jgi:hypothetical protein
LPDGFETAHGLNPLNAADAGIDTDGDGFTNYQEFFAGTQPDSPSSSLRVLTIQATGADMNISFTTASDKLYTVEYKSNPNDESWSEVAKDVPGTGGTVTVPDPGAASQPARIYRVRLQGELPGQ